MKNHDRYAAPAAELQASDTPRLAFTIDEAARAARIGRALLYRLIRSGTGPKVTKLGNRTIVRAPELQRWLRALEERSTLSAPNSMKNEREA